MTRTIPGFDQTGQWYKGNIHCHTTDSDGRLTPMQVVQLYKEKGYHFLAISDHHLFSDYRQEFDRDDFIILPAIEASSVLYEDKTKENLLKVHHIHGILGNRDMQQNVAEGLFAHLQKYPEKEYFGTWDGAKIAQQIQDDLAAHGCLTIYNHPVWSRVREDEFIHTKGLTALEIYNYGTVNESATGFDSIRWDVMLRNGTHIFATASDDNHNKKVKDSFGGYLVVKAEELTHEAIINAILRGSYYSSMGPEIYDWGIKNDIAYVECSPVSRVNFIAGNAVNAGGSVLSETETDTITKAEFALRGNETYLRAECVDQHGKIAWSNPIFLR